MERERAKLVVLAASAVLSAVLGMWIWHVKSQAPMVEFIDNTAEVDELLEQESRGAAELKAFSPDVLLERKPWTEKSARTLYPQLTQGRAYVYHDILGYRRLGNHESRVRFDEHPDGHYDMFTNSLGMRDHEPLESFDLRILLAGDSQSEGVCGSEESFANLMEGNFRARYPDKQLEVLNAALGGTGPWRYLSTLEAYKSLDPDIFVVVFYGGNDHKNIMILERYHRGRPPLEMRNQKDYKEGIRKVPAGLAPVELRQLQIFTDHPEEMITTTDAWIALSMEMARQCAAAGIEFFPVYLPPPLVGQPEHYAEERSLVEQHLPQIYALLDKSHEMADRWIEALRVRDVDVFDLRPTLLAAQQPLFWTDGYHMNLEGNRVVAKALEEALADLVARRLE